MRRVSFNVAKAINEAGYPQELPPTPVWFYYQDGIISHGTLDGDDKYEAPYVMDVWLWLWREQGIYIGTERVFTTEGIRVFCTVSYGVNLYHLQYRLDPEEAIIAAIEYLVENDLIK